MAIPAITQDSFLNDTSQFDTARKRASEQSAANLQGRKDAIARRFAALGNMGAGARDKQEQIASDEESKNLNSANEGINSQQQAELGRRREIIQGQQFQSDEALKGRDFAAGEALKGREFSRSERLGGQEFSRGERLGGQEFASGEAQKGREFATSERLGGQDFASREAATGRKFSRSERESSQKFQGQESARNRSQQSKQFNRTMDLQSKQMDQAQKNFETTFKEEVRVNSANMEFARDALNKKGLLESIFSGKSGGGGFSWESLINPAGGLTNFFG